MENNLNKAVALDYNALNAMLSIPKEGKIQFDKDKEAARQYFLLHVNKNMQFFHNLKEKLDYLIEEGYYDKELFDKYEYKDIKELFKKVYAYKFRFPSFVGAYKFYSQYALRTYDKERYLERFEDRIAVTALYLAQGDIEKAQDYAHSMITGQYCPATPTLLSAGRKNVGELVSCYLYNVDDNLESISASITAALQLSKRGGGVALCLTDIREDGSPIKNVKGASSGIIPIMKLYEDSFSYCDQLGQRQGAGAVYIHAHHPDIMKALDTKRENADEKIRIKTLSLGVVVPDITFELARNNEPMYLFSPYDVLRVYGKPLSEINVTQMYRELVDNKDISKKKINPRTFFQTLAEVQQESGYPYLMFEDTVNKANPIDGKIKMSNLCVAGDTLLLTENGFKPIKELSGTKQVIYNGSEWSEADVFKTGENVQLYEVHTSDGRILECTDYHKWYIEVGKYFDGRTVIEERRTTELQEGDILESWHTQPLFTNDHFNFNEHLSKVVNFIFSGEVRILDGYPYISKNFDDYDQALSYSNDLLLLGIRSCILKSTATVKDSKLFYTVAIEGYYCYLLSNLLYDCDLQFDKNRWPYFLKVQYPEIKEYPFTIVVTKIVQKQGYHDTYCVNEPIKHKAVFNGILTGNCSEILQTQTSSQFREDGSYKVVGKDVSCNLGSINVANAMKNKEYDKLVDSAVRMLTMVSDLSNVSCVPSIDHGNKLSHAVGLGQMNLHGFFMQEGMEYGDEDSLEFTDLYFMATRFYALKASNEIAKERKETFFEFEKSKYATGELFGHYIEEDYTPKRDKVKAIFEKYEFKLPTRQDWIDLCESVKEHGLYNQYLLAVAPTGSISYVNNATPCIHPITSRIEIRKEAMMGRVYYPAPYINNDNFADYKDAYELGYEKIIDVYAKATKHVDQGLSLTIFFKDKATTRDINKAQIYAWKKGIKTIYYVRFRNESLEMTKVKECISCSV